MCRNPIIFLLQLYFYYIDGEGKRNLSGILELTRTTSRSTNLKDWMKGKWMNVEIQDFLFPIPASKRARKQAESSQLHQRAWKLKIPISDIQPATTEPRASIFHESISYEIYEKRCCRLVGVIIMVIKSCHAFCGGEN